jgi:hypothetical protein
VSRPLVRIKKPRCFLVYALAPDGFPAAEANRVFNEFVGDRELPLVLFHDHFIGDAGGLAIFYAESEEDRRALYGNRHLEGWRIEINPLIFAHSPGAFDKQTAFTLRAYRGLDWDVLRREQRPTFGQPAREAETATEDIDDP